MQDQTDLVADLLNLTIALEEKLQQFIRENAPVTDDRITFLRRPPNPPERILANQLATWCAEYPSLNVENQVRRCAEYHNAKPEEKRPVRVGRAVRNWLDKAVRDGKGGQKSVSGDIYDQAEAEQT